MKLPQLDGYHDWELLEKGPCGAVFRARNSAGEVVAMKMLDGLASNRSLLAETTGRLAAAGWPEKMLEVLAAAQFCCVDFRNFQVIYSFKWYEYSKISVLELELKVSL